MNDHEDRWWSTDDWEEICRLLARYIASVDAADPAGTASLFLPHGALISRVMETVCEGSDAIAAYIASLRTSWTDIRIYLALPHIQFQAPDTASATTYFTVNGGSGADHWGQYDDQLRRAGGRWLFDRRVITLNGASRHSARALHR